MCHHKGLKSQVENEKGEMYGKKPVHQVDVS